MPTEDSGAASATASLPAEPETGAGRPGEKPPDPPPTPVPATLVQEIEDFRGDCKRRYEFNTRWDNVLNVAGLALSVLIIAAGAYNKGTWSAIMGGLVAAIVSAQKAYPFGQRALFYRNLCGQTENLLTDVRNQQIGLKEATVALKTLRLDFAQQLPRGTSIKGDDNGK